MADNETKEEKKADGRYKMVTDPHTGEEKKRVDYIRELCEPSGEYNWTRRQVADHLSEITGEDVRYQIVFAATKLMDVKKAQRGKPKADKDAEDGEDGDGDIEGGSEDE